MDHTHERHGNTCEHAHEQDHSDHGTEDKDCEDHSCNPFGTCTCSPAVAFFSIDLPSIPQFLLWQNVEFHDLYSDMIPAQFSAGFFQPPIG